MQNSIKDHSDLSGIFNEDESWVNLHDEALCFVRRNRDRSVQVFPEWHQLREYGSQIKNHAISNLDQYIIDLLKEAEMVHTLSDHKQLAEWANRKRLPSLLYTSVLVKPLLIRGVIIRLMLAL